MGKKTGDGPEGPLDRLLERADARTLAQLVRHLAATRPEVRRECSEFLSRHGGLTSGALTAVDPGTPLALWQALEPDLHHLRQHGEQDATWRRVGQLLGQLVTRLRQACPSPAERQALRD